MNSPRAGPPADARWDGHFRTEGVRADLRRKSIRSGAVQASTQVVRLLLLVGSGMVLARLLTPWDFGVFAMVGLLIAFVESFRDFGFPMAALHREDLKHAQLSALFWTSQKLSLLTSLGVAALAPALAWFYGEQRLTAIAVAMAGGVFVLGLANQHESLLMRQMRFARLRAIEIGAMVVGIVAGVSAALLGAGYWALVAQFVATATTRTAALWLACDWRPAAVRGLVRDDGTRSLLTYGADVTGFRIVTHIGRNLDRVLVGYFSGATAVGLYDSAYRWSLVPFQQVFTPLASVVVAAFSRVRHDAAAYRASCREVFLPLFSVVVPVLVFMAAEPGAVIRLLLGEQWLDAVPLFRLLCIGAIGTSVIKVTKWIYLSEGTTRRQFVWGLIFTPVMILSVVVGTRWGAYGVAAGFAAGTCLLAYPALRFCLATSPLRMRDFLAVVGRPLLASLVAAGAVQALERLAWSGGGGVLVELAWKLAVFGVVYLLAWLAQPGGRAAAARILGLAGELRLLGRPAAPAVQPAAGAGHAPL